MVMASWMKESFSSVFPRYRQRLFRLVEGSVFVYLDLGSIEDCDRSIYGIVEAIKDIKGIKSVIVNESSEGMDDFDM